MKARLPIALALIGGFAVSAHAATINLSGLGYVQYGDAQSYSLPIANYQFGFNTNNGPYAIPSTPGQIDSLVVLATGSSGNPVVQNFSGMDNAYATPSGQNGSTWFDFRTATYQGTTGTVANNLSTTWDTSLLAMRSFLGGDQMVVFFNNNQINSGASSEQSLAAWSRIWITDNNGAVVANSTFELSNNNSPYALTTQGGGGTFLGNVGSYTAPGSGPGVPAPTNLNGATDYVLSGGALCVATGGSITAPVPVACGSDPTLVGGTTISSAINHNLGADHAAYALVFPELNSLLAGLFGLNDNLLGSYTMHVAVQMGCQDASNWMQCGTNNGWGDALNNGFEQIFIGTAAAAQVPEPGTLALFGLALIGLGYRRYRKF